MNVTVRVSWRSPNYYLGAAAQHYAGDIAGERVRVSWRSPKYIKCLQHNTTRGRYHSCESDVKPDQQQQQQQHYARYHLCESDVKQDQQQHYAGDIAGERVRVSWRPPTLIDWLADWLLGWLAGWLPVARLID